MVVVDGAASAPASSEGEAAVVATGRRWRRGGDAGDARARLLVVLGLLLLLQLLQLLLPSFIMVERDERMRPRGCVCVYVCVCIFGRRARVVSVVLVRCWSGGTSTCCVMF